MKILIIDDEEIIHKLLTMTLIHFGHDAEVASNGLEGIRLFCEGDFDFIITDLNMPGLDGNEVAKFIRQSGNPYIPVIGMSGNPWDFECSRFDAIIEKPFLIKTFMDTIQNLSYGLVEAHTKSSNVPLACAY